MPRTSSVHAVTTIGMDMGKNTLHMNRAQCGERCAREMCLGPALQKPGNSYPVTRTGTRP